MPERLKYEFNEVRRLLVSLLRRDMEEDGETADEEPCQLIPSCDTENDVYHLTLAYHVGPEPREVVWHGDSWEDVLQKCKADVVRRAFQLL